ncbi:unnamed protein product [Lota lota]
MRRRRRGHMTVKVRCHVILPFTNHKSVCGGSCLVAVALTISRSDSRRPRVLSPTPPSEFTHQASGLRADPGQDQRATISAKVLPRRQSKGRRVTETLDKTPTVCALDSLSPIHCRCSQERMTHNGKANTVQDANGGM